MSSARSSNIVVNLIFWRKKKRKKFVSKEMEESAIWEKRGRNENYFIGFE